MKYYTHFLQFVMHVHLYTCDMCMYLQNATYTYIGNFMIYGILPLRCQRDHKQLIYIYKLCIIYVYIYGHPLIYIVQ